MANPITLAPGGLNPPTVQQQADIRTSLGAAALSHTHSEYALSTHTHADLAPLSHTHGEYALAGHSHGDYALFGHTHADLAPLSHTHNEYALADHTHAGLAPSSSFISPDTLVLRDNDGTFEDIRVAREYAAEQAGIVARCIDQGFSFNVSYLDSPDRLHMGRNGGDTGAETGFIPDAVEEWVSFGVRYGVFNFRISPHARITTLNLELGDFAEFTLRPKHPLRVFADDILALQRPINILGADSSMWRDLNGQPLSGEEEMNIGLELQAAGVNLNGSWMTPFVDFSEWVSYEEFAARYPLFFRKCGRVEAPNPFNDWFGWSYGPDPDGEFICYHVPDINSWMTPLQVPDDFYAPFPVMHLIEAWDGAGFEPVNYLSFNMIRRDAGNLVFKLP